MRILVVDDDAALVSLLKKYLNLQYSTQAQIETAGNGIEGLEKVDAFDPDVIVLDHMMPKMDGMHALDEIRKRPGGKARKVLIYSAFNLRKESSQHGADAFLQKPATVDQIQRAIDHLLAGK